MIDDFLRPDQRITVHGEPNADGVLLIREVVVPEARARADGEIIVKLADGVVHTYPMVAGTLRFDGAPAVYVETRWPQ